MLFLLTGDIQTGKTRWLQQLADDLRANGILCLGVIAPGVWIPSDGPRADANGLEKTGIDNLLLPQGELIPFARRSDLAQAEGSYDPQAQAARAQLGWHISDEAIAQVNAHFRHLDAAAGDAQGPGFLIVDELGALELLRNEGLTEAMERLSEGATNAVPHALAVVRESLLDIAEERFGALWGGTKRITPGEEAAETVRSSYLGA